jgi:hypothetical protein
MKEETEVIFHADRSNDESAKARQYDDIQQWTIESYNPKVTRRMIELGAPVVASVIDGHIFQVDARHLIEFIAASSGLVIEFRRHKKRQYSEETKAKLAERLRVMRQQQTV